MFESFNKRKKRITSNEIRFVFKNKQTKTYLFASVCCVLINRDNDMIKVLPVKAFVFHIAIKHQK